MGALSSLVSLTSGGCNRTFAIAAFGAAKQRSKDFVMVTKIPIWPSYFYPRDKIYYFDLLSSIA
jgi:hypothetical protein